MVGAARRQMAHVWGEEDAGYVGCVGEEFADGDEGGYVGALDHAPDVDVALGVLLAAGMVLSDTVGVPCCCPRIALSHR
jgi:hypothetical protein